ncbi:hypothetical protein G6F56_007504 [Rhizopus delemar]|nr:hypothetical protein G6F56_007504 [Rhizopus delemar]
MYNTTDGANVIFVETDPSPEHYTRKEGLSTPFKKTMPSKGPQTLTNNSLTSKAYQSRLECVETDPSPEHYTRKEGLSTPFKKTMPSKGPQTLVICNWVFNIIGTSNITIPILHYTNTYMT